MVNLQIPSRFSRTNLTTTYRRIIRLHIVAVAAAPKGNEPSAASSQRGHRLGRPLHPSDLPLQWSMCRLRFATVQRFLPVLTFHGRKNGPPMMMVRAGGSQGATITGRSAGESLQSDMRDLIEWLRAAWREKRGTRISFLSCWKHERPRAGYREYGTIGLLGNARRDNDMRSFFHFRLRWGNIINNNNTRIYSSRLKETVCFSRFTLYPCLMSPNRTKLVAG